MRMTVNEFVQDVMIQLRPFLKDGQVVEFELKVGEWILNDEGTAWCAHANAGESVLRFNVISNSEATGQTHGI